MNKAPLVIAGVAVLGVAAYLVYNQKNQQQWPDFEEVSDTRFPESRTSRGSCASDYRVSYNGTTYCLTETKS